MTAEKISFEQKFSLLKTEYALQLPHKVSEIAQRWRELNHVWALENLIILHRNVHTLTGTSGTFGFNEISGLARHLEIILKPFVANSDSSIILSAEVTCDIDEKIAQLVTLVDSLH